MFESISVLSSEILAETRDTHVSVVVEHEAPRYPMPGDVWMRMGTTEIYRYDGNESVWVPINLSAETAVP